MEKGRRCYRKGVFIVVYRKDRKNNKIEYLLLKRKLHWIGWEFPKGGIEKNESEIEAVKREIKEECGLKPIKIKKYALKGKYFYDKKTRLDRKGYCGQSYKLYSVQVPLNSDRIKIDKKEHSSYKFLGFKNAIKALTWEDQKKSLELIHNKILTN